MSNGDRTIFPTIKNPKRDAGIQAFKQGKYQDATKLFEEAVAANRNDPEVLIYYNNARARQSGEPLSLAVAVPADKVDKNKFDSAQQILRGVAQSQHQFNDQGGLNGRLLEIVIANDAGEPKQSKEVAAELIKNKYEAILGIIGHGSSESTEAALEEYNKIDIPVISPTSTSIFLEGDNFFRSLPSDTASAKKLADHAFNNLGIKEVAIFYVYKDSPYSNSMREVFTQTFENLGGKVVSKIRIDRQQLDANKEVEKSLVGDTAKAAVLFPDLRHIDNALNIANANKKLLDKTQQRRGFKQLLGGDILYRRTILDRGGNAIEGLITVVPWFRETSKARNFAQKAESQWRGGVSWRTATSFDATQAFIQALSSNPTRLTVIKKLKNVNIPANDTSGDVFKFNSQRERQTEPVLVYVENKKFIGIP
jgi:ABC-type branched-subunit amino acid transport system substrate-binding protein